MSADALAALRDFDPFRGGAGGPGRRYLLLDVFSVRPLAGNQLAVFVDARGLASDTMQALARELNLAETVFVLPAEDEGDVRVRIFTPEAELPFAGHPVLGSAAALAGALGRERVVLETGAGAVEVVFAAWRGLVASGTMTQPIPSWEPFARTQTLLEAMGVQSSGLPVELYDNGPRHLYIELESPAEVSALAPDPQALAGLGALTVSCFAVAGRSVHSRVFAAGVGIAEDAATGSAAGPLAVHLARHGRVGFGEQIEITQGVELGRPSLLLARASGEAERIERVEVGGNAVIVARGELWPD